jgi:single-strand DNA-binding protein
MSLSKIVVTGKVIKAPEKRFTPSNNVAVTEFVIAVESIPRADAPPESTPVKVTTWRDLAERCANELKKGDPVVVEGRLQINNFVTAEGQKRRDVEIDAGNVENLATSVAKLAGAASTYTEEAALTPVGAKANQSTFAPETAAKSNSDDLASIFASDDEIPF